MKYSYYNIIIKRDNIYILYNTFTENMIALESELNDILISYRENVDEIKNVHPTLYQQLLNDKFIIEENIEEKKEYINTLIKKDNKINFKYFRLIINPTLDCNLRCWYCYEKHQKSSIMDNKTFNNVKSFIYNIITGSDIKIFHLNFFGGEPLMKFQEIVFPLMLYTKELCDKNQIGFKSHFTTNAVLLTKDVIDSIVSNNIKVSFQIPFDGNREQHNLIKKTNGGESCYDHTLQNIFYGLANKFSFVIRCNCTKKNIDSFKELVDEFEVHNNSGLIVFSVQRVWQEKITNEYLKKERKLYESIFNAGFNKFDNIKEIGKCYADHENSIVINYNGDVYKCTANDFTQDLREGVLLDGGNIIFNNLHRQRIDVKYYNTICSGCKIYPICTVCTETKLRILKEGQTFKKCTDEQIDEMIINRIETNLNLSI